MVEQASEVHKTAAVLISHGQKQTWRLHFVPEIS